MDAIATMVRAACKLHAKMYSGIEIGMQSTHSPAF